MDAIEYSKQLGRMCSLYYESSVSCAGCPMAGKQCTQVKGIKPETVAIVEEWAKANPSKTRLSEFEKAFPYIRKGSEVELLCPQVLGGIKDCQFSTKDLCDKCLKDFWLQEVE